MCNKYIQSQRAITSRFHHVIKSMLSVSIITDFCWVFERE